MLHCGSRRGQENKERQRKVWQQRCNSIPSQFEGNGSSAPVMPSNKRVRGHIFIGSSTPDISSLTDISGVSWVNNKGVCGKGKMTRHGRHSHKTTSYQIRVICPTSHWPVRIWSKETSNTLISPRVQLQKHYPLIGLHSAETISFRTLVSRACHMYEAHLVLTDRRYWRTKIWAVSKKERKKTPQINRPCNQPITKEKQINQVFNLSHRPYLVSSLK